MQRGCIMPVLQGGHQFAEYGRTRWDLARAEPFFAPFSFNFLDISRACTYHTLPTGVDIETGILDQTSPPKLRCPCPERASRQGWRGATGNNLTPKTLCNVYWWARLWPQSPVSTKAQGLVRADNDCLKWDYGYSTVQITPRYCTYIHTYILLYF